MTLAVDGPILSVENLRIALPGGADRALAVDGVTLEIRRGEVLCVVGESGSGKSVLASAVMGMLAPGLSVAGGVIRLGGEDMSRLSERQWRAVRGRRIAMIPQEPMAALNPSMKVGRQVAEPFAIHGLLTPDERRAKTLELLAATGLSDPARIANAYPHELSGGQCQRVCIAMALALDPEVLIADEPTTALDVTTQAQVLALIRRLRDVHGHGIIFVTHDLGVVAEIADRVAVMQAGVLVEIGSAAEVLGAPRHPYTRMLLAAVPSFTPKAPAERPAGEIVNCLTVEGLAKTYGKVAALKGVGLDLKAGDTLAVVGESGSGKSTLAKLLVRLIAPTEGHALVQGADFARLTGRRLRSARRCIQMIFQDPFGSLNPKRPVGDIIARAARLAGDSPTEARRRAEELLALVGLSASAYHRRPAEFSGGQRQRVGIARALAMRPQILIADECVSALDVSVQAQILDLLRSLQARLGLAIIFITHDLRVAAQMADRIAVMRAGEIVEMGGARDVLTAPSHAYTRALLDAAPGRGRI